MKTILFGAGASIPFFSPQLTTNYITTKVCDIQEWDRIICKYITSNGRNHLLVSSNKIIDIINSVRNFRKNANFEQIAEVIDKISSYGIDKMPKNNILNLIAIVMHKKYGPCNGNPFGAEWSDVPFLFREIIAESILDLQNNRNKCIYNTLKKAQHDFIESICKCDDSVNVVSLNYDDCIFDSLVGLEFETGFCNSSGSYLNQLNIKQFMEAKKVLYFPHGNLKFQYVDNANVTFWSDSNKANDKRWENIGESKKGSTITGLPGLFSYNFNTFISTGQTKEEGMNHLPYAVYYQRLAIDLFKSDSVYIIGYSFGDNHINRLLMSFLQISKSNHIYVVDYYPDELTMTEEYKDSKILISKIHGVFRPIWEMIFSEENKVSPANPSEVERINRDGYGDLFPQITFYKKGYENFLKEYEAVIMEDNHKPRCKFIQGCVDKVKTAIKPCSK